MTSLPYYLQFKRDLERLLDQNIDSSLKIGINSSISKLNKYLDLDIDKDELLFAIILDARQQLSVFKYLGFQDDQIEEIKQRFINERIRYV